jgi:hypothetical protein
MKSRVNRARNRLAELMASPTEKSGAGRAAAARD